MSLRQRIAQVCLFLFAAIGIAGGTLQMMLGEPETTPRLDNIHRFLAGIYLGAGFISLWTGITIRRREPVLIMLIAIGGFLGGIGRIISMTKLGTPEPPALWFTYLGLEIIIPLIMVVTQMGSGANQKSGSQTRH